MLKEKMVETQNQVFSKHVEFELENPTGSKARRTHEVYNLVVTVDGYDFDADEESMNRMDRIIDVANWRYNQGLAQSLPPSTVYKNVYKDTYVPWKTATNEFREFSIETICKVQEKALRQLAEVWVKYG